MDNGHCPLLACSKDKISSTKDGTWNTLSAHGMHTIHQDAPLVQGEVLEPCTIHGESKELCIESHAVQTSCQG